jgi:glutathione peroxidase
MSLLHTFFDTYFTRSTYNKTSLQDIDGRPTKLDKYKGKVVLVVNLASACGFTPQYAELQELFQRYSSKGLVVLGFPVSGCTHN